MSARILVADDETSVRDAVGYALEKEGFDVTVAEDGGDAEQRIGGEAVSYDLLILDIMMPGPSGLDICREVRARSAVPIIILTAKDAEVDKVVGLEVGADDYVTKPYRMRELVARMRAVLRRGLSYARDDRFAELRELVGAIEAVRAKGLEVPDDIALVCLDDIEYASRLYPFLTVMAQPAETLGTLGTQLLLDRIEGRTQDQTRVVVLPARFIVRRSCGALQDGAPSR